MGDAFADFATSRHRPRDPANAEAYTRRAITTTAIGWWRRKSWHTEQPNADVPDQPVSDRQPDR